MGSRWGRWGATGKRTLAMGMAWTVDLCEPICENQAYNRYYTPSGSENRVD